jgi:DNA-directed RNA polymerase subunit delta
MLQQFSKEELQEMSLIEIAYALLAEKKQAMPFQEIIGEIAKILDLSEEEVKAKIAQFYTELNIDGRFLALGENRWGLRIWYPVDQIEEEIVTSMKPKKKKAKKLIDDEDDLDYDDLDEEDLDYDDLDEFGDDEDLLDDEDDVFEDDELDDADAFDDDVLDEDYDLGDEEDLDVDIDLDDEDL